MIFRNPKKKRNLNALLFALIRTLFTRSFHKQKLAASMGVKTSRIKDRSAYAE